MEKLSSTFHHHHSDQTLKSMPKRPIVILEVVQWLVVEWNCDAAQQCPAATYNATSVNDGANNVCEMLSEDWQGWHDG